MKIQSLTGKKIALEDNAKKTLYAALYAALYARGAVRCVCQ